MSAFARDRIPRGPRSGVGLSIAIVVAVLLMGVECAMAQSGATTRSSTLSSREADERLAIWLERQGLDRLLAGLLEERLSRESSDIDRRDAAERLRDVLLRRLRKGELDPGAASEVAEKLRSLLPAVDADELAIELLRSRQRLLEQELELFRIGQGVQTDGASITQRFVELAGEIDRLQRRLDSDLRNDDRKLDRSVGLEAEALLDSVDRKRALLESARFAQAWCLLHASMNDRSSLTVSKGDAWRVRARAALEQFIELLDTGVVDPTPDDVSVDRRGEEPYASALLGTSLAKLLLEGHAKADPWFALLAEPRTASTLRRSAPGWKLAALVLTRDFVNAKTWLDALLRDGPMPSSWLRLVIVESRTSEVLALPGAPEFVQNALAALAAQEDLGQVLALAEELPATALPTSGFLAGYIRGLRAYAAARALPTETSEAERREAFRAAARTLRAALGEADAAQSALGLGAARQLAGWSLVGAGDFDEASALFEQAAETLPSASAAESLWLAAEAAERAAASRTGGEQASFVQARRRILDRLIELHPESAFAIRAEVQRIRQDPTADADALARLRAVPRGSPAWGDALAAAEELLYQRVRMGGEGGRVQAAAQYLETARAEDAPDAATQRTWLRRRAEVALVPGVDRVDDALAALTAIRARAAAGEFEIEDIETELRLRDLQIAAIQSRFDEAMTILESFEQGSAPGERDANLVRLGRRAILRAAQRVNSDRAREVTIDTGASLVVDEVASLEPEALHAAARAVGRAARDLAVDSDGLRWRAALGALARAQEKRPNDLELLEVVALLAERVREDALALDTYRSILAGTTLGEPAWFEARVGQVRVLARVDPAQARRVLDQHRALVPEWGPEPWGSALRSLDRSVS